MAGGTLLAGVARVEITPPAGIWLFGYHRPVPMTGVRDPLWVTALALVEADGGGRPVVLLAVDHVGMGIGEAAALRAAAAATAGTTAGRVAACFSHTHSGPDTERLDWNGRERPATAVERRFGATLPGRAAEATRRAMQRLAPARVGVGVAGSEAGVNRRARGPDGRVVSNAVNPDGPVDRRVAVLRVDAADGRPLAAVVHYGIHGTVFRKEHLACSADAPGAARATVEAATGAPCLFVQGAAGDVNPRWRGDDEALRRTGWDIGGAALQALAAAVAEEDEGGLAAATEVVPMRLDPLPEEAEAARRAEEVARVWGAPTTGWLEAVRRRRAAGERDPTLPIELQAVRVGRFVRVGLPMEPFAELALAVRARTTAVRAAGRPACVAFGGYTNGVIGYLAPAGERAAGGYEIEWNPVVYGYYEGLLTPPVAAMGEAVVAAAARLAGRVCESA